MGRPIYLPCSGPLGCRGGTLISMTDFRATQRHGLSFAPVSGRHRAPGPTGVRAQPIDLSKRSKHNEPQETGHPRSPTP